MFERYINEETAISQKQVTAAQWHYFLTNLSTVEIDSLTTGVLKFYTDYTMEE